jgi:hypothetical protein
MLNNEVDAALSTIATHKMRDLGLMEWPKTKRADKKKTDSLWVHNRVYLKRQHAGGHVILPTRKCNVQLSITRSPRKCCVDCCASVTALVNKLWFGDIMRRHNDEADEFHFSDPHAVICIGIVAEADFRRELFISLITAWNVLNIGHGLVSGWPNTLCGRWGR